MGRRILDEGIMRKIADKTGKNLARINETVSRKASKLGISPEAALILLAKEHSIGTAIYQRGLDSAKQAEIRSALAMQIVPNHSVTALQGKARNRAERSPNKHVTLRASIESLIQDNDLKERCVDLLLKQSMFDRPINQATLVLEDRIRTKSLPPSPLVGEHLVNFAFKDDPNSTVLLVASREAEDQRGFTQIMRGIVPAFRNKTHHHLTNSFSREDAIRVCAFIDVLLRVVDKATKVK